MWLFLDESHSLEKIRTKRGHRTLLQIWVIEVINVVYKGCNVRMFLTSNWISQYEVRIQRALGRLLNRFSAKSSVSASVKGRLPFLIWLWVRNTVNGRQLPTILKFQNPAACAITCSEWSPKLRSDAGWASQMVDSANVRFLWMDR